VSEIVRWRKKPSPGEDEDQLAARYEHGRDLAPLLAVARMADEDAEIREVLFGEATWVLLVRYLRFHDDHPATIEYETIEPGKWLAYSGSGDGFLYDTTDGDWRQWYDKVDGDDR
jgi:hypothetical protein